MPGPDNQDDQSCQSNPYDVWTQGIGVPAACFDQTGTSSGTSGAPDSTVSSANASQIDAPVSVQPPDTSSQGGMCTVTGDGAPYSSAGTTPTVTATVGDPENPETPAIFPNPIQHGAPTKPVSPDPHVDDTSPDTPPDPNQGPYRTPAPRPTEPAEPTDAPSSSDSTADKVLKVLIVLGLSVALVPTVLAAIADPEPATKLALAGLTVLEIEALAVALGFSTKSSSSSGGPEA